jgi:hypothetical protein
VAFAQSTQLAIGVFGQTSYANCMSKPAYQAKLANSSRPGTEADSRGAPARDDFFSPGYECPPPLSALDGRTIAVQIQILGREQTLLGRGTYTSNSELGNVLTIQLPSSAACEIVLVEGSWTGEVLSGELHGCDFLVRLF